MRHRHDPRTLSVRRSRFVGILIAFLSSTCGVASNDPETQVLSCEDCIIDGFLLATISDSTYPSGALVSNGAVHVNADGSFIVAAGPMPWTELYHANGNGLIDRRIGASGEGPGEYKMPQAVMETNTSYIIFDGALRRLTWLSKSDFGVRMTRTVHPMNMVVAPRAFADGAIAIAARGPPAGGRETIHFLDSAGEAQHSINLEPSPAEREDQRVSLIATSADGGMWTVRRGAYRIQKWSRDGRLERSLERKPDWLPEAGWPDASTADNAYVIQLLHEDHAGRLWVHVTVRRQIDAVLTVQRGAEAPAPRLSRRTDPDPSSGASIIEVIHPVSGQLIASVRWSGVHAIGVSGGFYLRTARSSPSGEPLLDIWGFRLRSGS